MSSAPGPQDAPDLTALLAREARSLVQRLRTWTPTRFAAAAGPGTRGDLVHHLAASLAVASGAPVPLPRLVGEADDLALPDQLAVVADDLVRSAPSTAQARAVLAHLLLHRSVLLGDEVPAGLLRALEADGLPALRRIAGCDLA